MASHSSGIPLSEEARAAFSDANHDTQSRILKVQIKDDQLQVVEKVGSDGKPWEEELDKVPPLCEAADACYILFRTDVECDGGYQWALFCYVPDRCKVRQKMLYASTRAELKLSIGSGNFAYDLFGTVPDDFSRKGFEAFVTMQKSEAPLTESEEQRLQEIMQSSAEVGSSGASSVIVHGVSFAPHDEAKAAIARVLNPSEAENYAQLGLDEATEQIILRKTSTLALADIQSVVPNDIPAFHVLRYSHEHEGAHLDSVIFVYSCPDGSGNTKSAPVKSRMIYSSSKSGIEALIEETGHKADLKLEINDGEVDISEEVIVNKLHPPPVVKKAAFSKPKAGGRGPRRLVSRNAPQ